MTNLPDWIMAVCAVGSLGVAIAALLSSSSSATKVKNLTSQVTTLTAQVTTLNTEVNRVSSTTKDSKIKQVNKSGSDNQFIGGGYNERS